MLLLASQLGFSQRLRCAALDLRAIRLRGQKTGSEFLEVAVESDRLVRGSINHGSSPTIINTYSIRAHFWALQYDNLTVIYGWTSKDGSDLQLR